MRRNSIINLVAETIKALRALDDSVRSALAQPVLGAATEPLYRRLTTFPEKSPNIEEERKALVEGGYGELVQKISEAGFKVLLGFLFYYGEDGESVYKAFEIAAKLPECSHVIVEDFSTDSLTVSFMLEKYSPNLVEILTLKRRGRAPGVYRYTVSLQQPSAEEAPEAIRASLEGSLDVDHLIEGLRAFAPLREVVVIECDPGGQEASFCTEKLIEVVKEERRKRCNSLD